MALPQHPTPEIIDEYIHGLLDVAANADVERLCRERADWMDALNAGRQRLALIRSVTPPATPRPDLGHRTVARVLGQNMQRRQRRRRGWFATLGSLATAAVVLLALGLYVDNTKPPHTDLEIFGQHALLADAPGSLRVMVTDRNTRKPLANIPVQVALRKPDGTIAPLAQFATDARGTGGPVFFTPDWSAGNYTLQVSADTVDGTDTVAQQISLRRDARLMLSTDKPVYQPGQTIHARALALRRPDLKPLAQQPAVFTITDPKGNVIFKKAQPSSQFGIVAADCELAAEVMEGTYTLRSKIGTTESSVNVEVRKYVLPKFKVDVMFDRTFYKPGDTVRGEIKGQYFFGQPVADGTVIMEVRTEEPGNPVIDRRTVKTNSQGAIPFEFVVPKQLAGRPQDQGDARFTMTVQLRDTAGQESGRTFARVITNQDLRIEAIPEAGQFVPGLENRLFVYVSTPDGQPVRAKVRCTYGGVVRDAESNSLGVAAVMIHPQPDVAGAIQLSAHDDRGRSASRAVMPEMDLAGEFLVRLDKAVYSAGDTMQIRVLGNGSQPVFVDLIRDGQTMRTDIVDVKDNQGMLDIDLPAESAGTLQLCAYRFLGNGLPVRKVRALVVKPPQNLQVKLAADKPEYRPGETAKLQFTLTNAAGQPTPGAISLAAVDEAVFSVLEQRPGLEKAFYLLEQELLKPVTTIYPWSLDEPLPLPDRDLFEQALFATTARTMKATAHMVTRVRNGRTETLQESNHGPHSLVLSSLPSKQQAFEALKQSRLGTIMRGWLGLGLATALAGYVALCQWLGIWRVVIPTAFFGILATIVWFTMNRMKDGAGMFGNVMSRADAKASEMLPPGMMAAPGLKAESGEEPLRVRDKFPETLLWRPEIVTDDQGRATLEVPLADSITTWRMTASAVSADGRLGALQSGIRVFQPFFVDMDLPVSLTRNDEVSVPVIVSNFLDQPQTVMLTLADADWFERTGPAQQMTELPARAVRSVSYRLKIKRAGRHQLEVTARGQNLGDAVRRTIEVVPDGRPVEQVVSGNLDRPIEVPLELPADVIPDSAKLLVRLYPSAFSQLVEGLDAIFQMPFGCFEQTSSTTYPNILALHYLKQTKQSNPQVEAKARQFIHVGYQRLLSFEVPGGGFDWFGHAPADVPLTAYGLREFIDMAQVHDVDPDLIQRTRRWLLRQRQNDGFWLPGKFRAGMSASDVKLMTTAYVAAAVFAGKSDLQAGPTRDFLLHHAANTINDGYTLAQVVLALQAVEADKALVQPYIERLLFLKKSSEDGKQIWWTVGDQTRTCFYGSGPAANIEATALAAQALMKSGDHPGMVRGCLNWLVGQKDVRGTWHSTQATVLALQSLTMGSANPLGENKERRFTIQVGEHRQELVIAADQGEVMKLVDLSPYWKFGPTKLVVSETSNTGSGYQIVARHHVAGAPVKTEARALTVSVAYDRNELSVGDVVRATAKLKNNLERPIPMVMLDLPIPGGFAPDLADFNAMVANNQIAKFQVTPRQVIVYLRQLEPQQELSLSYRLKATMPVSVAVSGVRAYEYYNPASEAKTVETRLTAVP